MPSFTGRPMGQPPARRRRGSRRHPTLGAPARPASSRRAGPHWLRRILLLTTAGLLTVVVGTGTLLYTYAGELPSLDHLSAQNLPQTTRIYARDGVTLLEERYQQRRTVVPLNEMSWDLRHATISIEDKDFYNHGAVNPVRMVAAGVYDLLHQRAAQGGSTITQQLVKNYLLSGSASSRSLDRKARELVPSTQLERQYTKDQILEMYLNTIFYGNQSFGVEAAAQTYFGTSARRLDLAQSSFIAGLPQRPSYLNPFLTEGYVHARDRQHDVLTAMVRDGDITAAAAAKAYTEDLGPKLAAAHQAAVGQRASLAPHFVDYVWSELEQRYDPSYLLRSGLKIVTTLDPKTQALAQQAVHDGIARYASSYRVNNGAMLVMNPHTGEVLAMVGSADYSNVAIGGQVNYTTALRQPGSSFKPYTYITALMNGWTPASPLDDSNGAKAFPGYPVHDWDSRELGTITLRESLQKSRNISSVHLFKDVGIQKVFSTARSLGIDTPLDPSLPTTVAAKSGTTTDFKDAWYIGYTSDLAVASWMGRTLSQPTPHNESMSTRAYGGLWGEIGPASSWKQFMKAYYGSKKPADWARPAEVAPMTLCKLTGQPAAADLPAELAVQDLAVTPDPALPLAGCGSASGRGSLPGGTPSGDSTGLPGVLPSLSPLPLPTLPPIVP